ncbi:MAG: RNA methyltransferase [Bacteroidales bacterium]|jgi:tRNA G18 (ribose-2'-O)-methylase SpoU|nr:RNA methyltransferase [Bacteroidales bacterium]
MRKLQNSELNRISVDDFKDASKTPIIVVLDNIRSLNNIGSVFRTADAFLVQKICLCGITCTPPHRDINKTALGATESVEWQYYETTAQCIEQLKKDNIVIVSIEQTDNSILLDDFFPEKDKIYAVVFGNEVHGVEDEIIEQSDVCIEIAQYGTKHSLNISVCCGIVLYNLFGKMLR